MKYIATTNIPALNVTKGQIVEMDKPSPGFAPITIILKDRTRPPMTPAKKSAWQLVAKTLTMAVKWISWKKTSKIG